jgi:hypothetical protein
MANYRKALVGSLDMERLEGPPNVVIGHIVTLVQKARRQGYTNLSLKRDHDSDLYTGKYWDKLDLYGFKKESDD